MPEDDNVIQTAAQVSSCAVTSDADTDSKQQHPIEQSKSSPNSPQQSNYVKIVSQQADSAALLVEGEWKSIGRGVVVYIGFQDGATSAHVKKAARYILHLPLLDDIPPVSLINYNKSGKRADLLVVPQAKIISRISARNRLTYSDQCSQATAEVLYQEFLDALRSELWTVFNKTEEEKGKLAAKLAELKRGPIPPSQFFKSGVWVGKYATYKDSGFPLTTVDGKPLSKKQTKKLTRLFDQHVKKYTAFVSDNPNHVVSSPGKESAVKREIHDSDLPFSIVAGTFGAPQQFRHEAVSGVDAGPNTHLIFI